MSAAIDHVSEQDRKARILTALSAFVRQRPGIEPGNYGDMRSYRSESRSVTRDLHDAEALIRYASIYSISADSLVESFRAFSGRLSIEERPNGSVALDYCTGQYFPTEYRKAACAVLGTALFYWVRADYENRGLKCDGDLIRKTVRNMIGARLQRRWCD